MSTKKKFRVPHSFVIVFSIIIAAVLLTWIIPAGEYARVENADGIKVIDPTQFNYIARTPVNPLLIPMYIVKAFIKRVDIMLVILFSGGAFHMLTQSGALQAVIAKLAKKFSNNLYVFIPILTLMFGLICTTQAVNMFIAFAPVMVMLALAIGLDSITGAAIILLGGAIGFSTGTLNPNTTVVAQKIAELPLYSGIGYRWVCFAVYYVITNIFLVRYALKIKKDPTKSPMYDLDQNSELRAGGGLEDFGTIDTRRVLNIIALVVSLGVVIYGSIKFGWDMPEMAAMFIWLAIVVGIISGFDSDTICKNFLEGCKKMMSAMIIIGLAQSISSIMTYSMNLILVQFTVTATAVFGVYFKLQSIFFMPVFGLNNGITPIIAYNYGARHKKRMIQTIKVSMFIAFCFTFVGFLAYELIPKALLGMFNASDDMLAIGIPALRIIGIHYLIAWFCIIAGTVFQALGKAVFSMIVSIMRQLFVLVPAAYILASIGGLHAVWWSFPIAEIISLIISVFFLMSINRTVIQKIPEE